MFSRLALLAASTLAIVMIGAAPVRPSAESPVYHTLTGRFGERSHWVQPSGVDQSGTSTAIVEVMRRNRTVYVDWRIMRTPMNLVFCGIAHAHYDAGGQLVWQSVDGWGNHGIGTLTRHGDGYALNFRFEGVPQQRENGVADFYQSYRLEPSDIHALNS